MSTVINNPDTGSEGGIAGWIVAAVVIVVAALVALFVWPGYGRQAAPAAPEAPVINVQVPVPTMPEPEAPAPAAQ